MSCIGPNLTQEEKEQRKVSREIDQMLQKYAKTYRNQYRLLLLGPGESGKSTIFKQMKIISKSGGYSEEELMAYRYIIYGNCITQMKVIVSAAFKLGLEFGSPDNRSYAEEIARLPATADCWNPDLGRKIQALWADPGIRTAYEQKDKIFQLNDSACYFFDEIERFIQPNYVPSEQDILRSRVRTTGIEEAVFDFEDMSFRMVDVGGQRAERRKWIHCFDAVTAVMFCASMSDYDQTLREDSTQNRMHESLSLFDEICNSPWFRDTTIILFLNKSDLFKNKIQKVDLKVCFEDYGGGCDFDKGSQFIKSRFLAQNHSPHTIYPHFTCAINTENVEFVFRAVRKTLLDQVLSVI